ncbi:MAG: HPr family phosphocarrier protein [Lachnospiraceae bacterium]
MIKKPITVQLDRDLDARPTALLVQEASRYVSQIYIELDNKKINAKSIMGMMSLQLSGGDNLTVIAEGKDEKEAADGMESFFCGTK